MNDQTANSEPENGVRHLVLPAILVLLLIAPAGRAVTAAEHTPPVSDQTATPAVAAAKQETGKPAREVIETEASSHKWQPPPMPRPAPFATVNITPEKARELAEEWGVELLGIRATSAGYMLDFRFRVLDADKALPLFDHRIKPYVVAVKSDIKLPVPVASKVGAFRPTNRGKNIKADKTYYMLFANPDSYVKSGEKVSVVIGDFKVEQLTVH